MISEETQVECYLGNSGVDVDGCRAWSNLVSFGDDSANDGSPDNDDEDRPEKSGDDNGNGGSPGKGDEDDEDDEDAGQN